MTEKNETLSFRLLRADEIDCRIATVSKKGVSLLLYKDARVDQNILDETVGPMNWQRSHSRDNANCTVSIWDKEKGQWVSKEDTGKESNTEAEKGLASDSFKRACFNWGIGRELYTAPFIWIDEAHCNIRESGRTDWDGKPIQTCNDRFRVSQIGYDDNHTITSLVIVGKDGNAVFTMGNGRVCLEKGRDTEKGVTPYKLDTDKQKQLYEELKRTGVGLSRILRNYGIEDVQNLTEEQWQEAIAILKKKPNLPEPPENLGEDPELPWNDPER